MMRTWFEAPIAYAPPPSPMQLAPGPSSAFCHEGLCVCVDEFDVRSKRRGEKNVRVT